MTTKNNNAPAPSALINSFSASDSRRRRVSLPTLTEVAAAAATWLHADWTAKKAVIESTVVDDAAYMVEDVLSAVRGDLASLGNVITRAAAARRGVDVISAEDVTVSKSGKSVNVAVNIRDNETGASARVSIAFPLDSAYGEAFGAVTSERK